MSTTTLKDNTTTTVRTKGYVSSKKARTLFTKYFDFDTNSDNDSSKTMLERVGLQGRVDRYKLAKAWAFRNYHHGDVFVESLEVENLTFQESIFIEESKELSAKLLRLGFEPLIKIPTKDYFNEFSYVLYHSVHNIAINLYKPKFKSALYIADDIVTTASINGPSALAVFVSSIQVLSAS